MDGYLFTGLQNTARSQRWCKLCWMLALILMRGMKVDGHPSTRLRPQQRYRPYWMLALILMRGPEVDGHPSTELR